MKDGICIKGHFGTWYIIGESCYNNKKVFLLESEQYGQDAASLIVDDELNIIMDGVCNGFSELDCL